MPPKMYIPFTGSCNLASFRPRSWRGGLILGLCTLCRLSVLGGPLRIALLEGISSEGFEQCELFKSVMHWQREGKKPLKVNKAQSKDASRLSFPHQLSPLCSMIPDGWINQHISPYAIVSDESGNTNHVAAFSITLALFSSVASCTK